MLGEQNNVRDKLESQDLKHYLTDEVLRSTEKIEQFIAAICKMNMKLDENILSKDEYQKALEGKRHWRDFG
ncbi:MAG: hypothetical protein IIA05_09160 [Proteobacteria bacterium]|nr:hypothetical protein [Pseudomonadota bacterium]